MNSMHISNARQAGRKAESSSWFSTVNRNLPMRIEGRALSVHARPVDCVVTLQNGVNEMLEAKLVSRAEATDRSCSETEKGSIDCNNY